MVLKDSRIVHCTFSCCSGAFDIKKNIPLISGISSAGILTLILIIVITWRLTRKSDDETKNSNDLPPPPDDLYTVDELSSSISNNRPVGNKEWYV